MKIRTYISGAMLALTAYAGAQVPELTNTMATNIDQADERQAWREALEMWTDDNVTFGGITATSGSLTGLTQLETTALFKAYNGSSEAYLGSLGGFLGGSLWLGDAFAPFTPDAVNWTMLKDGTGLVLSGDGDGIWFHDQSGNRVSTGYVAEMTIDGLNFLSGKTVSFTGAGDWNGSVFSNNQSFTGNIDAAMVTSTSFTRSNLQSNENFGWQSLNSLTSGVLNVAFGTNAGDGLTTGGQNVFIGNSAARNFGANLMDDIFNTVVIGQSAGTGMSDSFDTIAIGYIAGQLAFNSEESVFIGRNAGRLADNAERSIFIGKEAGQDANAPQSIYIGYEAGESNSFTNSIGIGYQADVTASNQTVLGNTNTTTGIIHGDITFPDGIEAGESGTQGEIVLWDNDAGTPQKVTLLTSVALNGDRLYTIPDAGGDAQFLMSEGFGQNFNGGLNLGTNATFIGAEGDSTSLFVDFLTGYSSIQAGGSTFAGNIFIYDGSGNSGILGASDASLFPNWDLPSVGGTLIVDAGSQNIGGVKSFSSPIFASAGVNVGIGSSLVMESAGGDWDIGNDGVSPNFDFTLGSDIYMRFEMGAVDVEFPNGLTIGRQDTGAGVTGGIRFYETGAGFDTVDVAAAAAYSGSFTYTIPDAGANADFVMTAGAQNIGGAKTFDAPVSFSEQAADPADPAEGKTVLWQSDGTGFGDDGDLIVKITAGGVTKTVTLIDFSAAIDEEP